MSLAIPALLLSLLSLQTSDGNPPEAEAKPASFSMSFGHDGPLIRGMPVDLEITALDSEGRVLKGFTGAVVVEGEATYANGEPVTDVGPFQEGTIVVEDLLLPSGRLAVKLSAGGPRGTVERQVLLAPLTVLPPLLAILLALLTRQVLLSLFSGVWLGVAILHGGNPLTSFLTVIDTYLIEALSNPDHAHIVLFSLALAGMVGIMQSTGGIHGIVKVISELAQGRRSGQISTWLLGIAIFFDDYANSLIVGNTMRPFTDKVRISREKLSFIVDATAAPVATVGIISTWTAYQLGIIGDVLPQLNSQVTEPYLYFIRSIPYSFYSLLMLVFVFLVGLTLRDFGPMRRAEERCLETGRVLRPGAQPLVDDSFNSSSEEDQAAPRWYNAAIPIICLVAFTLAGLVVTGLNGLKAEGVNNVKLHDIFGRADAYKALLWASTGASLVAGALGIFQRYKLGAIISSWVSGVRSLILAVMILLLAWSISSVCQDLRTPDAVAWMTPKALAPQLVPLVSFLVAGFIAFSTGTSYGTMGILIPILLPLSYKLSATSGLAGPVTDSLGFATLASILGGSVFGDHCSPISDTTVLSSMASGADHIDHVRTQLPYAILVASICAPCYLLSGLGLSVYTVILIGLLVLVGSFLLVSKKHSS